MTSFKAHIRFDRSAVQPVFLQVANGIMSMIRKGLLIPATRIPASRILARELSLHRKTVVNAYEELIAQGWLESFPRKGIFVTRTFPEVKAKKLREGDSLNDYPQQTHFIFDHNRISFTPSLRYAGPNQLVLNDGFPDVRLAPLELLMREYRSIALRKTSRKFLNYSGLNGALHLREALVEHLRETRGLFIGVDNLLITKGAQMAIYLAAHLLLKKGDGVVVGDPGYFVANMTFTQLGGKLLHVPVDNAGIDVDAVERLCKRKKVRLVYIIPHHHQPTTVTLSPERRIRLLELAAKYRFAILEDDYDFDIHYDSSPIMPMASLDHYGNIIYVGTLSKTIAPAVRIGFMVAPENFIHAAARMRWLMDMQGDTLLEETIASLYNDGVITRHLKKVRKIYQQRRDIFCNLLKNELNGHISFAVPSGGMSVWTKFNNADTQVIKERAALRGLQITDGKVYNRKGVDHNSIRMGFASLNEEELQQAVSILHDAFQEKRTMR